jgi:hypothetical protein
MDEYLTTATNDSLALNEIAPGYKIYIDNLSNSIILYSFLLRFKNIHVLDFKEAYIGGCVVKLLKLMIYPKNSPAIIKSCCIFMIKLMQNPFFGTVSENSTIFTEISEILNDFSPLIQYLGGVNYENLCKVATMYLKIKILDEI